MSRHPFFVEILEDRGEVAVDRGCVEPFDGSCNPRIDLSDSSDDQKDAHRCEDPFEAIGVEKEAVGFHEPANEADLFARDHKGDCKGA